MLNGGVLDQSTISVTSNDTEAPKLANIKPNQATTSTPAEHHDDEIEQEGESLPKDLRELRATLAERES